MILRWVRSPVAPKMTAAVGGSVGGALEISGGQGESRVAMDMAGEG